MPAPRPHAIKLLWLFFDRTEPIELLRSPASPRIQIDLEEFKEIMRSGPADAARVLTRATARGVERQRLHDESIARERRLKQERETKEAKELEEAEATGNFIALSATKKPWELKHIEGIYHPPMNGMRNVSTHALGENLRSHELPQLSRSARYCPPFSRCMSMPCMC